MRKLDQPIEIYWWGFFGDVSFVLQVNLNLHYSIQTCTPQEQYVYHY